MPAARPTGLLRPAALLAAALLVPSLAGSPASAAPATGAQPSSAVAPPTATATAAAPASDIVQPTLREVPLAGVDKAVLAKAPAPDADHAKGLSQSGTKAAKLKPAVAAQVSAGKPAVLVAVAADADFPTGSSIQVRVKEKASAKGAKAKKAAKARWSSWTELEVDPSHGPDPDSAEAQGARVGSSPLMTSGATTVQVRIDTPGGKVPSGTELTLVNAPAAASDARTSTLTQSSALAQSATVGQPAIVSRAQWGANESWRSRAPYFTSDIRVGFIHHTASTSNYSASQAAAQIRAIYSYHTKSLGHSDIDYNFVVDRFGRLYEGRYGGIDQAVLGGHTAGFNEHSFAVVALGNFQSFKPSSSDMGAMKDSIARLFAWKLGLSGVNPAATVKLVSAGYIKATKYAKGKVASISATSSHQTVNYTSCPGKYVQAQLASIRALAASYSNVVITSPSPPAQSVQRGSVGSVSLASAADRAVIWTADVLSPCSDTPVRSYSGTTAGAASIPLSWDLKDSAGQPVLPATYTVRMSGTAADGSPVATVSSTITITPEPGGAWGPCANASRVAGASTAATSVLWGRISAPAATTVVLSGIGESGTAAMASALAAAPLARSLGAPLLQTPVDSLAGEVSADITSRHATQVLIVGGADVVSDAVANAVASLGAAVTRIAGPTPADTAAAVAARMPGASAVLVSPDGSPASAIAGAALAAAKGAPLLLGTDSIIPAVTAAALAGRSEVVVASAAMADPVVTAAVPAGVTWTRLSGADSVTASLAVAGAFPGSPESMMLLPENASAWPIAPAAAATGAPLVITSSPILSQGVVDFIRAHPALRATTTPVTAAWLDDQVLGATSRILLGLPWSPPGVTTITGPTATATRKVAATNAGPEPVRKGKTLTVTSKVKAKFSDGKYRAVPAGVAFTVQFKATGAKKYKAVAKGATTAGKASARVKATKSGRWRIVVGSKAAGSDYVRVKK